MERSYHTKQKSECGKLTKKNCKPNKTYVNLYNKKIHSKNKTIALGIYTISQLAGEDVLFYTSVFKPLIKFGFGLLNIDTYVASKPL